MRKLFVAVCLALATAGLLTVGPATSPASAQAAVSVSLFYRELAPHGRWFQHPRWGWAWFPAGVSADWRPYSRGRWVWTEEHGWYWESEEVFGWATYHYGRWAYDEEYGWIWIPGRTWGPAWVAFRYSDDHVGWAPLPPETLEASYDWDPGYTDLSASYYQPRWVFIPRRYFLAHRLYAYAVPPSRNYFYIRNTRNVTRYERGPRGVFNRSIEPRRLEAALGRRITPVRLNLVSEPRRVGPDRRGTSINVFRADVRAGRDAAPPETARARPADRPRFAVRRDAVAPTDRRERSTQPPAPPSFTAPDRRTPDAPRTATPDGRRDLRREREERRVTPGPATPPSFTAPDRRTPDAPRTATPDGRRDLRRERDDRRVTPGPATPPSFVQPSTPRAAPPDERRGREREERRVTPAPATPPSFMQPSTPRAAPPEIRRGREDRATPPAPRVTQPSAPPPSFARPPQPQGPPPSAAPPRVTPAAPPQPRAAPPAPQQRAAPPAPAPKAPPPKEPPKQEPQRPPGPLRFQQ